MRTSTRKAPVVKKERHKTPLSVSSNGKRGTPQIYDPVRFPHIAETLCAEYGFTNYELAKVFGVSLKTIEDWVYKRPEFKKAIQTGKDVFDGQKVENALLRRALGYEFKEVTQTRIWVNAKDAEGNKIKIPGKKITEVVKEIAPDPKSCMFWLTNRNPERWKMVTNVNANVKGKIEHEHNHSGTVVHAQLENLNNEQLLALRDMVAIQEQDVAQIEHRPEDVVIDVEAIMASAEQVRQEMYEDDDGED